MSPTAEHNEELSAASAQENLQQEKRSAQEVDNVLMHRLLSPIQSAVLILQARSQLHRLRVGASV